MTRDPVVLIPAMPEFLTLADALAAMRRPAPCQDPARRDLWQSHSTDDQAAAVAACSTCPARPPCLDYARTAREPVGVWGGEAAADRRARRQTTTTTATDRRQPTEPTT